ncbi:unnamed protein product [Rhizoctonia solani]|uniref:G-patch domain-containing protein n=1 Tax=Rhizoctonia solani TaxID=456999 RepID=A0A8H3CR20_9AGAM|nr:unnamed protein product [Rhizoctonia solani]
MAPSELSAHVIFLGLDQEFNEADLTAFLITHHAYPTSVTIIRDRNTGKHPCLLKSFGFAEFASPEAARVFVEPNFPFIYIPPKASQLAQGYSEDAGRRVKIDYSQSAQPRGPAGNRMHNDGTRDIGNTQAPVVLLRGVDFQATVEEISEAVKESTGPKCEGLRGARKVMLVRDKQTRASLGFAFVEYINNTVSCFPGTLLGLITFQAASRLLAATMSPELHPSGFRIGSRAIAASFAHPSSFQPLENRPPDEYSLVSTHAVGGSDVGWCSYWDQTAFAEVQEFQVDQETIADLTAHAAPEAEKKKEKKKDRTKNLAQKLAESAGLTVLSDLGDAAAPSAMPQLSKPLSLSLNKAVEGDKKIVKPGNAGVFGDDDPPTEVFGNINKWNNAQGELSGKKAHEVSTTALASSNLDTIAPKPAEPSPPAAADELPYGDRGAMTCLLCARQFKSVEMLKRHSNESDLHKTNLGKPELVEAAKSKVEAARQGNTSDAKPKYRDRAAERRVALRQPDHPMPELGQGQSDKKRKWAEGPPLPPPPPPPPVQPAKDESNVGNKLLKKMGWSEGAGLGAGGDGRVNPVETSIYEQGVGIGAGKAKEVTNFQGYREMVKDSARDRYNSAQ